MNLKRKDLNHFFRHESNFKALNPYNKNIVRNDVLLESILRGYITLLSLLFLIIELDLNNNNFGDEEIAFLLEWMK